MVLRNAMRSLVINTLLVPERWRNGVVYNPLSARTAQNPYPDYARLRSHSPVHRSRLLNAWVFSRYADVDTVLRDHRRFSSDPAKRDLSRRQQAIVPAPGDYTMLLLDPPDHTRLRALVNKAFTRRAVNALEPHIRGLMNSMLDDVDPAGFDLMEAVANPLPVIVIAEMLGVPPEDRARFRAWSDQRARLLEPTISPREREIGAKAGQALSEYFLPIIQARRAAPESDIVSALARAEEEGDVLTEREVLNMLRLLLVAGNETTTNLIGNGVLALLRNPDQLERLRADPALIPSAVEELLRFDSPVQTDFRGALEDCEVNGFPVRRRQNIVLLIGSANRDPRDLQRPGPARRRPLRGQPHLVRPRHPPLHRGAARAPRRAHRPRSPAGALRLDASPHRASGVPRRRRPPRPRVPPRRRRPRLTRTLAQPPRNPHVVGLLRGRGSAAPPGSPARTAAVEDDRRDGLRGVREVPAGQPPLAQGVGRKRPEVRVEPGRPHPRGRLQRRGTPAPQRRAPRRWRAVQPGSSGSSRRGATLRPPLPRYPPRRGAVHGCVSSICVSSTCLTRACGRLGLAGSTVSFLRAGSTTRSMSSIGTTPSNTSSPSTSAPT